MAADNNRMVLARNLAYYIEKSGKQQKEIAENIGVSTSTFNDWMMAKKYPRIDKVEKLATYFGIQKSDLIESKPIKLYENIKRLRKTVGLTQSELAETLEYTDRSSIARVENGEVDLPVSKAIRIADIFGVTLNDLIGCNLSKKRRQLINAAASVPEDKLALALRLINSVLEEE